MCQTEFITFLHSSLLYSYTTILPLIWAKIWESSLIAPYLSQLPSNLSPSHAHSVSVNLRAIYSPPSALPPSFYKHITSTLNLEEDPDAPASSHLFKLQVRLCQFPAFNFSTLPPCLIHLAGYVSLHLQDDVSLELSIIISWCYLY